MNWNTLLDQYSNLNSFHLYGTLCGAAALFSLSFPEAGIALDSYGAKDYKLWDTQK